MGNRKGEQTKAMIVQKASRLLNRQGYMASSISSIMHETGLRKGGIYNHFESKEELMLSAFSFAVDTMKQFFQEALAGKQGCVERLLSIASVFERLAENELLPGGCPIMNAAIESDDSDPVLRESARGAMDTMLGAVRRIVQKGIADGELKASVDSEQVASVFMSTLEGSLMLSKLYGDVGFMKRGVQHLQSFLTAQLRE